MFIGCSTCLLVCGVTQRECAKLEQSDCHRPRQLSLQSLWQQLLGQECGESSPGKVLLLPFILNW